MANSKKFMTDSGSRTSKLKTSAANSGSVGPTCEPLETVAYAHLATSAFELGGTVKQTSLICNEKRGRSGGRFVFTPVSMPQFLDARVNSSPVPDANNLARNTREGSLDALSHPDPTRP